MADAVAQLFAEGGFEAVTIPSTAERLSVSRATLYRTVPTKEDLLGILFERSMTELVQHARAVVEEHEGIREQLYGLIRVHIDAAIRMRHYMPVFFGGAGLPPEVFDRWHGLSRAYEKIWCDTVEFAMTDGVLERSDPVVTTRLLLGMCIWVSRWYRPEEKHSAEEIAEAAIRLLHFHGGTSAEHR
ncbi:TetR/AcrR family transcriptional regulator [Nocardia terrae]|uniref:TetR/AcrR family transcriptional regulator n=1 Tax=Nocardia terrae TaxID=2675851 RepID=UPI002E266DE6